jgi:hypothetical protein
MDGFGLIAKALLDKTPQAVQSFSQAETSQ